MPTTKTQYGHPFNDYVRHRHADVTVHFTDAEFELVRSLLGDEARKPHVSNPPRTTHDLQVHGALWALRRKP